MQKKLNTLDKVAYKYKTEKRSLRQRTLTLLINHYLCSITKSTSYQFGLLLTIFLILDYKINVAEEKMIKPQIKPHQTVLCGSIWVGLGKSAVRFWLEKCQTVYLRFGLGYIPNRTIPNRKHS